MDFNRPYTPKEIADLTQSTAMGAAEILILGFNEIHHVRIGDITFCDHPKYMETALNSAASCIIINEKREAPEGKVLLYNENPFRAYNKLVLELGNSKSEDSLKKGIGKKEKVIDDNYSLSLNPYSLSEGVVIGAHVKIGAHSFIGANTVIYSGTVIGENVRIGANCVIGSDAFYFKREVTKSEKWVSGGGVMIADHVDIGALCTINKGVSTFTTIGEHTKIDCHVHVGHDTVIGARCLIAAQVGISGNVIIEDDVIIYGQVGVAQNVIIGAGAVVLGQTGVTKSIEGKKKYVGTPVQEVGVAYRQLVALKVISKRE